MFKITENYENAPFKKITMVDKDKQRETMRRWRSNPINKEREKIRDKERRDNIKNNLGKNKTLKQSCRVLNVTEDEYNNIFNLQKGRCAICNTHFSELKRRLYIDHSHYTGKIRGLLCQKCNSGLGFFKDDISLLQSALAYLDKTDE